MTVIDYFLKVPCFRIHFQRKFFFYKIYPKKRISPIKLRFCSGRQINSETRCCHLLKKYSHSLSFDLVMIFSLAHGLLRRRLVCQTCCEYDGSAALDVVKVVWLLWLPTITTDSHFSAVSPCAWWAHGAKWFKTRKNVRKCISAQSSKIMGGALPYPFLVFTLSKTLAMNRIAP